MREWPAAAIVWGETGCEGGCGGDPAELTFEGVPLCIGCADTLVEREQTLALASPGLREQLVGLWAEERQGRRVR